jgi:hypothetical protein
MTGMILCAVLDCSSSCRFSVRIEKWSEKMTGTIFCTVVALAANFLSVLAADFL